MKKQLKIFGFIYLAFLLTTIISCGGDCGPFPNRFSIKSFDWHLSNIVFTENYYISSEIVNNEVSYKNYGIQIFAETEEYYSTNFSLIDKVYACDPILPITDDIITKIEVIVNQNFNDAYPLNSNMANEFKIGYIYNSGFENINLLDYINSNPKVSREFTLLLNDAPLENGEYTFTVKITMEGRTLDYFEFTTNPITIINN